MTATPQTSNVAAPAAAASWTLVTADDPTDWKDEFAHLRSLDASLRCDLCYDIFTAPVAIKDCHHTFCSACVRNAINQPGAEMGSRCPKCLNKNVYDSSLLPQPALEQAAQHWRVSRPLLFAQQKQRQAEAEAAQTSTSNLTAPRKRTRRDDDEEEQTSSATPVDTRRRSTRSLSARQGNGMRQSVTTIEDSSDSESESIVEEEDEGKKDYRAIQANDLVQCPMCSHTFTMRMLNVHLDKGTCQPSDPEPTPQERGIATIKASALPPSSGSNGGGSSVGGGDFFRSTTKSTSSPAQTQPRKKLVRLNYDLCKPIEIKRTLEEWRLPTTGERKRLIERHRKWVNLYNANLDASEKMRKSDAALRQELSVWERSYDRTGGEVTEKKVKTWAIDHKDEFARLAAQARETHVRDKGKHDSERAAITATTAASPDS